MANALETALAALDALLQATATSSGLYTASERNSADIIDLAAAEEGVQASLYDGDATLLDEELGTDARPIAESAGAFELIQRAEIYLAAKGDGREAKTAAAVDAIYAAAHADRTLGGAVGFVDLDPPRRAADVFGDGVEIHVLMLGVSLTVAAPTPVG